MCKQLTIDIFEICKDEVDDAFKPLTFFALAVYNAYYPEYLELIKSYIRPSSTKNPEELLAFLKDNYKDPYESKAEIIKIQNDIILDNYDLESKQYIDNYKNLESIASKQGYSYKSSTGSHKIYEHENTRKIVVIPAHNLGKGLSLKIQKQIINNSKI